MLVLSRKQQQQIKIGDQITVTIVRVKGNTVRVGIEAPRDLRVIRAELPKAGSELEVAASIEDGQVDASSAAAVASDEHGEALTAGHVVSFRVRCEKGNEPESQVELAAPAVVTPSAAHLPLKRIHDRLGNAPLRQLLASCATLAK